MTESEPTTISSWWEGLIRSHRRERRDISADNCVEYASVVFPHQAVSAMEVVGDRIQAAIVSCPCLRRAPARPATGRLR